MTLFVSLRLLETQRLFQFFSIPSRFTYTPVIKEEFLSSLNGTLGKYSDSMVSIHHHHLGIAVRIDGMICKTYLVPFSCRVHNKVCHILKKKVKIIQQKTIIAKFSSFCQRKWNLRQNLPVYIGYNTRHWFSFMKQENVIKQATEEL